MRKKTTTTMPPGWWLVHVDYQLKELIDDESTFGWRSGPEARAAADIVEHPRL